jgi:hypothetical protein
MKSVLERRDRMTAKRSGKVVLLLAAFGLVAGCTSTSSSSSGVRWPWTKPKSGAADLDKGRDADVLGSPPPPKHAKAGVNKPSLSSRYDATSNVTLKTPRIIDDREVNRAAR